MRFGVLLLASFVAAGGCGGKTPISDLLPGDGGSGGSGGTGPYFECSRNTDCVVVSESCCGSCGQATRGDAVAVNVTRAGEYRDAQCQNQGCPGCFGQPDPTLAATCEEGRCVLVDLVDDQATACRRDADCRVRTRDCCECTGDTSFQNLIAINRAREARYTSLVCNPDQSCGDCAPFYQNAYAVCTARHCTVTGGFK